MSSDSWNDKRLEPLLFCPKILAFHKLMPRFSFGATNFSPQRFKRLLAFLQNDGYLFQSVTDVTAGRNPTGSKCVALTFDDGYQHLSDVLPPLMEEYGIRPHIFIPTACIGADNRWDYNNFMVSSPHLDVKGIRRLAALGAEFGSHGHRHLDLTGLKPTVLQRELSESKKLLEDLLGKKIDSLSYPFGRVNRLVVECALNAGYRYGFTMGFPNRSDHALTIGRFAVYGYDTLLSVKYKLCDGPAYRLEKLKAGITNRLSMGTVLLNRLAGREQL